ncbi:carbohydrate kinase [Arthrobacter sp. PAMC 25486]|uniref:FGGY-family carbohydrate kinase n=1 Tax=Arthrobacter sp. PAMC 25486 TaxID=1494608 RepID=UPI000535D01E|nr:FGGY-family carbohydrate kinase [Arthrobacter sp. PAMC 25486]AIY01814.1 carbohydrate kinase [Arthrobacter sp. PAMC 25486]
MFLGIDVGTGSSKAVLTNPDGSIVGTATITHQVSLPRPGWAEFDAENTWWEEVISLCGELFARHDPATVAGVSISGMGPCLVVTDADFTPLRPAILYGVDTRAERQIEDLNREFGDAAMYATGGKVLSSQAVGPKLRWLADEEPEIFDATRYWFSASSFLTAKLTGEYILDHHTASQCDPLYDIHRQDWIPERTDAIARHIPMPRLAWSTDIVGTVTAGAAAVTGIPAGTPVCAGTVDAWAEGYSAGVRQPGDLMLMYGSTMFFVQVLEAFHSHRQLWTTAGVEQGTLTLAGGMSTSGSLITWLAHLFGDVPMETLMEEALAAGPGADGLLILPYFAGERSPILDPDARGTIIGLTLRHGRGHLVRAALEGIAFGLRQSLELFESSGQPIQRILAVGGGTQGTLWTQLVSDILGRPQIIPEQTIGASYGDALMAAIATGAVPPETDWTRMARVVEPDPASAPLYDTLYDNYCRLYPATGGHMHALARIQRDGT